MTAINFGVIHALVLVLKSLTLPCDLVVNFEMKAPRNANCDCKHFSFIQKDCTVSDNWH
jgi:hypothetical protein